MKRTASSLRRWLEEKGLDWDAVVFDIDGVLVLRRKPLAGGRELIAYLRSRNVPIKLLTNDGNNSVREKRRILESCGLDFQEEQITSSGHALVDVVQDRGLAGERVFIMGKLGDPCYAELAGVSVTRRLEELPSCAAVIMGEEGYAWEPTINGVVNYFIQHPQSPFIVPNPDLYFPTTGREIRVAAGGVAEFIRYLMDAYGVSIDPIFLGKPHLPIFRHCHSRLEALCGRPLEASRILMVGDSLAGDIRGARDFGYRSALVLTGLSTEEMLARSTIRPDYLFAGL
jgi:HAD superfamily hydrolase (TIGR01450 family)